MEMTTGALRVMEEEPPGRNELKLKFVELRARGLSYAAMAKKLKMAQIDMFDRK
jgi:hypothetical protein